MQHEQFGKRSDCWVGSPMMPSRRRHHFVPESDVFSDASWVPGIELAVLILGLAVAVSIVPSSKSDLTGL